MYGLRMTIDSANTSFGIVTQTYFRRQRFRGAASTPGTPPASGYTPLAVHGDPCEVQPPCDSCEHHWVQDSTDCMIYYRCYDGRSYKFECSTGLVFSMQLKTCVTEDNEYNDCEGGETEMMTSPTLNWAEETEEPVYPTLIWSEETEEAVSPTLIWAEETEEAVDVQNIVDVTPPVPRWFSEPADTTDIEWLAASEGVCIIDGQNALAQCDTVITLWLKASVPSTSFLPTVRPPWTCQNPAACGLTMAGRIVGGSPANIANWPWQVSLQLIRGQRSLHFCGGVLIDSEWILLAAHCVYRKTEDDFFVLLGTDRKSSWPKNTVARRVYQIYMHPEFHYGGGYPNDVALIRMGSPVSFNAFVMPACLPSHSDDFSGEDCYITGFGETLGTSGREILNELKIRVLGSEDCVKGWGENIYDSHICLGNGTIGACWGDSGGPLSCLRHGRFVVAGVASWGFRTCNRFGYPNVYTRIASHVDWINAVRYAGDYPST